VSRPLDYHLVSEEPTPIFMGELPTYWSEIPAPVVINLCGMYPGGDPLGMTLLCMPMFDVVDSELAPTKDAIERFLVAAHVFVEAGPTYWHCHAGINRSGFLLAAYLHLYRRMRISEAIAHLRVKRVPIVLCNSTFEKLLRTWYGDEDEQAFEPFSMDQYLSGRERR
jgi:hypothetical protein